MYLFHLQKAKFMRSTMYQIGIDGCEGYLYYSKTIEFMFLGMSMFWARFRLIFA